MSEKAINALKKVIDPEIGADIVSLGFVEEVNEKGDSVHVKLLLSTPGCPLVHFFSEEVRRVLEEAGYKNVEVEFILDKVWTPDRISDDLKKKLGVE